MLLLPAATGDEGRKPMTRATQMLKDGLARVPVEFVNGWYSRDKIGGLGNLRYAFVDA
jgi:hypothetical protein